jgi:hypothetical protein
MGNSSYYDPSTNQLVEQPFTPGIIALIAVGLAIAVVAAGGVIYYYLQEAGKWELQRLSFQYLRCFELLLGAVGAFAVLIEVLVERILA